MTIKQLINAQLLGAYEKINLFDISEHGHIFEDPVSLFELPAKYHNYDILRISADMDDIETPYICLDINLHQLSLYEIMKNEEVNNG